jgi:uncharacterized protein (DUF2141 family)
MRQLSALVAAFIGVAALPAGADEEYGVQVQVATFQSVKGALVCRLFADGRGFPVKPTYIQQVRVPVTGKTTSCSFPRVKAGTYAVAVFHDENGNGKLDTNFLGIPSEGVGVSNNATGSFGPPKWDDAKFLLRNNALLKIQLHY